MKNKIESLPLDNLIPFENHPYKVIDNEEMAVLVESIKLNSIMVPLAVRALDEEGKYEIISGHRRIYAAKQAGLETVPALIYALDRNSAAICTERTYCPARKLLPIN